MSTQYNTINFGRTIERILGLPLLHLTDAVAQPMADVFDITQAEWTFSASPADMFYNTTLPLPARTAAVKAPKPLHDARYWAQVTKGLDFSKEDRLDPVAYNRILWQGLKSDKPYPGDANLAETHRRYKEALKHREAAVPATATANSSGNDNTRKVGLVLWEKRRPFLFALREGRPVCPHITHV